MLGNDQQYADRVFSGLNLKQSSLLGSEFDGCVFERCTLIETAFERCRFTSCRFVGCDLSLLKVPQSRFQDVDLEGSKALGIDWTKLAATREGKVHMSMSFRDSVLDLSSFFGVHFRGGRIERSSAKEVDFAEADLRGLSCRGTDFLGAKFQATNLERADFREALNYAIDPRSNRVKRARFSLPEAVSLLRGFDVVID